MAINIRKSLNPSRRRFKKVKVRIGGDHHLSGPDTLANEHIIKTLQLKTVNLF